MIYTIQSYEVYARDTPTFASVFSEDGPWPILAHKMGGHIHTDLLQRFTLPSRPSVFLTIEFWVSERRYDLSRNLTEVLDFNRSLQNVTASRYNLGVFAFLGRPSRASSENSSLVTMDLTGWRVRP